VIHPTAEVSADARIGSETKIWHHAQVREGACIGSNCIVGKGAYIDVDVHVGNNVKIENGAFLYRGLVVEDGVFIGPQVCMTNDCLPRAIMPDGRLKGIEDWTVGPIRICYGAAIGACAVVLPNVTIGRWALVAAGSVVVKSIPDHGLAVGTPARLIGYVCRCARRLEKRDDELYCATCDWSYRVAGTL
jgi:acetyltransferase-like isoleucine patch superfamily enzyme